MTRRHTSLLLSLVFTVSALAITTVEVKVTCPLCHTENDFQDYASWGSYIYRYKSRFQMVFFPHTWSTTLYTCKKCHLSLFMWDFKDVPKEKLPELQSVLAGTKLAKEYESYTKIPMSEKLVIAEKCYVALDKDDEFWQQFYRLMGYHFDNEKKTAEAAQARTRSLAIITEMLKKQENESRKKELLVYSGILHHFLGKDEEALRDFNSARDLKFKAGNDDEQSKGYDGYLSERIDEYLKGIPEKTIPTDYIGE